MSSSNPHITSKATVGSQRRENQTDSSTFNGHGKNASITGTTKHGHSNTTTKIEFDPKYTAPVFGNGM